MTLSQVREVSENYDGQQERTTKAKVGGVRVLYHYSKGILIILITLYSKNEMENITDAEKNTLKKLMPELVRKYKEEE